MRGGALVALLLGSVLAVFADRGALAQQVPGTGPEPEPADAADVAAGEPAPAGDSQPAAARAATLQHGLLDPVQDRTRGIRDEEYDAYYQVLEHARHVPPEVQKQAAARTLSRTRERFQSNPANARRKFSLFYEMVTNPHEFRGELVTLRGYIHKLESFNAGENDQGLENLHQAWLFTEDSLGSPYVVVCSEIPPNLPIPRKGHATNDIVVTGYFFKLWSYEAERGNWGAPLILAHRLEWAPQKAVTEFSPQTRIAIALVLALFVAGLVYIVRSWTREERAFREAQSRLREAEPLSLPPDLPDPTPWSAAASDSAPLETSPEPREDRGP